MSYCCSVREGNVTENYKFCHPRCVCVRTWRSVGSQTQLSVRCNYVLRKNYMFRSMVAIVRTTWENLKTICKLHRVHNVEISTCLVSKV